MDTNYLEEWKYFPWPEEVSRKVFGVIGADYVIPGDAGGTLVFGTFRSRNFMAENPAPLHLLFRWFGGKQLLCLFGDYSYIWDLIDWRKTIFSRRVQVWAVHVNQPVKVTSSMLAWTYGLNSDLVGGQTNEEQVHEGLLDWKSVGGIKPYGAQGIAKGLIFKIQEPMASQYVDRKGIWHSRRDLVKELKS
ncbi:hypothetical protein C8J56DRAFT_896040 [Mycena floridula]|nr:hypothetical protein C8J56DRAFT_896040 [Mycena floridula]